MEAGRHQLALTHGDDSAVGDGLVGGDACEHLDVIAHLRHRWRADEVGLVARVRRGARNFQRPEGRLGLTAEGVALDGDVEAAEERLRGAIIEVLREQDQAGADAACSIIAIASETPAAVQALSRDNWHHPRLQGMMWGAEDLAAELGALRNRVDGQPTQPFRLARNLALVAAKAAGVLAIDTVYADFRDGAGLQRECEEAAADGFDAKAAIHPAQLSIINDAYTPTPEAVAWAEKVVAIMSEATTGVASLNGQMLDQPHLKQAMRILARLG